MVIFPRDASMSERYEIELRNAKFSPRASAARAHRVIATKDAPIGSAGVPPIYIVRYTDLNSPLDYSGFRQPPRAPILQRGQPRPPGSDPSLVASQGPSHHKELRAAPSLH
jgi:hypothetical protein